MRVVFMGTPDFAVGTLQAIVRAGHKVTGVVTQPDKPVGRSGKLQPTAVKKAAQELGLTVYQPEKVRDPAFMEILASCAPDVIVVAAFGQIVPKTILEFPEYGCLNVHASLLPKYRGAAPIQWAVIDGEQTSGVTIMQMGEGLDTGDMLAVREISLRADETGGSLFDRLSEVGADLLVEFLQEIEEKGQEAFHPVKQPKDSPNAYARMITKADGLVDWNRSAEEIERMVRGLDPWPCAFTKLGGKTLKIWKTSLVSTEEQPLSDANIPEKENAGGSGSADRTSSCEVLPGTVIRSDASGLEVQCGQGSILIEELQLEGKKRMLAADFLRGHAVEHGTKLG